MWAKQTRQWTWQYSLPTPWGLGSQGLIVRPNRALKPMTCEPIGICRGTVRPLSRSMSDPKADSAAKEDLCGPRWQGLNTCVDSECHARGHLPEKFMGGVTGRVPSTDLLGEQIRTHYHSRTALAGSLFRRQNQGRQSRENANLTRGKTNGSPTPHLLTGKKRKWMIAFFT